MYAAVAPYRRQSNRNGSSDCSATSDSCSTGSAQHTVLDTLRSSLQGLLALRLSAGRACKLPALNTYRNCSAKQVNSSTGCHPYQIAALNSQQPGKHNCSVTSSLALVERLKFVHTVLSKHTEGSLTSKAAHRVDHWRHVEPRRAPAPERCPRRSCMRHRRPLWQMLLSRLQSLTARASCR